MISYFGAPGRRFSGGGMLVKNITLGGGMLLKKRWGNGSEKLRS